MLEAGEIRQVLASKTSAGGTSCLGAKVLADFLVLASSQIVQIGTLLIERKTETKLPQLSVSASDGSLFNCQQLIFIVYLHII